MREEIWPARPRRSPDRLAESLPRWTHSCHILRKEEPRQDTSEDSMGNPTLTFETAAPVGPPGAGDHRGTMVLALKASCRCNFAPGDRVITRAGARVEGDRGFRAADVQMVQFPRPLAMTGRRHLRRPGQPIWSATGAPGRFTTQLRDGQGAAPGRRRLHPQGSGEKSACSPLYFERKKSFTPAGWNWPARRLQSLQPFKAPGRTGSGVVHRTAPPFAL